MAQAWANVRSKRTDAENKKSPHNPNRCDGAIGENVYSMSSTATVPKSASDAVQAWYDEIKDYDFAKGKGDEGKVVGMNHLPTYLLFITILVPIPTCRYYIRMYIWIKTELLLLSGHFTQVVWKETTEMGIAYATWQDTDSGGKTWNRITVVSH